MKYASLSIFTIRSFSYTFDHVTKEKQTNFSISGLWVIFPAYMTIVFGADLLKALDMAVESSSSSSSKKR